MGEEKQKTKEEEGQESRVLAPREPFGELLERWPFGAGRSRHLERLLRELDEEWPGSLVRDRWLPALDIHETDGEYAVTVELAGARKEDVTVECHDGILTIRGEKKSEREEEKEQRRFVERRYGAFSRSFSLPSDADAEKIDANFENGVLTLTIPKTEAAEPRTVVIR